MGIESASYRAHARPLAVSGAAINPARWGSASVWRYWCSSGWGWLQIPVSYPRGQWEGRTGPPVPAHCLELRSLNASSQLAAFADLQVEFFAGAWPDYPSSWSPRLPFRWRRLEARASPVTKDALSVPQRLLPFCMAGNRYEQFEEPWDCF
ncbi:hypothetical protein HJG60_009336 [Phyllostomus discolor]|uniref:Uncharacterized protein n=1 Tax=Phyllostomus discolor TaxID=89673 RepID=A0A833YL60_9CHIR|nr:hypothetical protein HJG60_009336 [Phyllostomus discolor]